jgi:hypothetical protein
MTQQPGKKPHCDIAIAGVHGRWQQTRLFVVGTDSDDVGCFWVRVFVPPADACLGTLLRPGGYRFHDTVANSSPAPHRNSN